MNCNECLANLEEYVENSLEPQISKPTAEHVAACGSCRTVCDELEHEREIYSRYLLKITERPASWNTVLAEIRRGKTVAPKTGTFPAGFYERFSAIFLQQAVFAAMAVLVVLVVIGLMYRAYVRRGGPYLVSSDAGGIERALEEKKTDFGAAAPRAKELSVKPAKDQSQPMKENRLTGNQKKHTRTSAVANNDPDQSPGSFDSSEAAFNRHLENCEMVLRSFRNAISETNESGFNILYERRLSKELLKNSVRFRREAESQSNLQVEELLAGLEAFLGDIAKLPAKPTLPEVIVIKGRIQESGIIGRLQVRSLLARATD